MRRKTSKKKSILYAVAIALVICLFFSVPALAVTESEIQAQVDASGKETVAGNVLIWFLCAVAFLKVSQKIDSFMASLGGAYGRLDAVRGNYSDKGSVGGGKYCRTFIGRQPERFLRRFIWRQQLRHIARRWCVPWRSCRYGEPRCGQQRHEDRYGKQSSCHFRTSGFGAGSRIFGGTQRFYQYDPFLRTQSRQKRGQQRRRKYEVQRCIWRRVQRAKSDCPTGSRERHPNRTL